VRSTEGNTVISTDATTRPGHDDAVRGFAWPLRVYWEDTDAGGVVFYANYLKFFERARTEWLRSLGFEQQVLRESEGGMFIVIDAALKYHRPARLDDQLLVTTWTQTTGRVCMTIGQQARLGPGNSGELLCEATIRIGWVSAASFKPRRIPSTIVKALS
jgi:acyl-CoA thioester hydrolase